MTSRDIRKSHVVSTLSLEIAPGLRSVGVMSRTGPSILSPNTKQHLGLLEVMLLLVKYLNTGLHSWTISSSIVCSYYLQFSCGFMRCFRLNKT